MIVIGADRLRACWAKHPKTEQPLRAFVALARRSDAAALLRRFAALLHAQETDRLVFTLPDASLRIEARLHASLGILRIETVTVTAPPRSKGDAP